MEERKKVDTNTVDDDLLGPPPFPDDAPLRIALQHRLLLPYSRLECRFQTSDPRINARPPAEAVDPIVGSDFGITG